MLQWFAANWFQFLQGSGIVAGLFVTAYVTHRDSVTRRASTYLQLIDYHRTLWSQALSNPELRRVDQLKVDLIREPITQPERLFAIQLIMYLSVFFEVTRARAVRTLQNTDTDTKELFECPIMRDVWFEIERYQDSRFVAFIQARAPNLQLSSYRTDARMGQSGGDGLG